MCAAEDVEYWNEKVNNGDGDGNGYALLEIFREHLIIAGKDSIYETSPNKTSEKEILV